MNDNDRLQEIIKTTLNDMILKNASKNDIEKIKNVNDFITVVNSLEKTPQRGFSYKPNSAIKLSQKTFLFHSTTKVNIELILGSGFSGVGAYYSSFTKTRKSEEQIKNGNFGFAFDLTNKKIDSRFQKGFLYGGWGIVFKSEDSCKVYNAGDKQYQVVFDVTKPINIVCVVHVKMDTNNRNEWIWDVYDTNFYLIEENIKLSNYLKTVGKR